LLPVVGDREHNVADIAHAATNSIVQAVAKELRRLGLQGGLGDDRNLRKIVCQMVFSRMAETQCGIPYSGEAPMNDEMETSQRVPIKGNM
jgi:hypothetical protein